MRVGNHEGRGRPRAGCGAGQQQQEHGAAAGQPQRQPGVHERQDRRVSLAGTVCPAGTGGADAFSRSFFVFGLQRTAAPICDPAGERPYRTERHERRRGDDAAHSADRGRCRDGGLSGARGWRRAGSPSTPRPRAATGCSWRPRAAIDLVILDRMLPGLDGLSILKAVRAAGLRVPVLMLTAMSAVDERVRGLRAGRRRLPGQAVLVRRAAGARRDAAAPAAGGAGGDAAGLRLAGAGPADAHGAARRAARSSCRTASSRCWNT